MGNIDQSALQEIAEMASAAHEPHITHYQVIRELNLDALHVAVETAIHNGWQPYGSLVVNRTDEGDIYLQPIVRYTEFYR